MNKTSNTTPFFSKSETNKMGNIFQRISAIQMCSTGSVDENIAIAGRLIEEAARHGAGLIVLPEMFPIIGRNSTDKVDAGEEYGNGKIQNFLSSTAKRLGVLIVGGTIPVKSENDPKKIRAASILYNSEGEIAARYDKIHLFNVTLSESESYRESETTEPGSDIVVVDTPFGRLGMAVCFDIRFPEMFSKLFREGVEIISLPSAFTIKTGTAHWEILMKACAVQNFSYVIGACQGGRHDGGRETYGHSMIVDPWATTLDESLNPGNSIVYADVDLDYLHKIRSSIPLLSNMDTPIFHHKMSSI